MVFINLCKGLDKLGISYEVNVPFDRLRPEDRVGVLGRGRYSLKGYDQPNPIVAGVALMTHPSQWPTLCEDYPVVRYLQHSDWASDVYRPYFGDEVCEVWPVGIDTDQWRDDASLNDSVDVLIYDKIHWNREELTENFLSPIKETLRDFGLRTETIRYGSYTPSEYQEALGRSRSIVFLSSHESQGLACQEALASDVPIYAWDPGQCLDPNRYAWGDPYIQATSVPYFDDRCGMTFTDLKEFLNGIKTFWAAVQEEAFRPREYILESLTLRKCAKDYVSIVEEVYSR